MVHLKSALKFRASSGAFGESGERAEKRVTKWLSAQSAKIEAEHLLLPTKAPWLDDFKAELLAFPAGRYDD
jgi:phage terminase large subunit-like protein